MFKMIVVDNDTALRQMVEALSAKCDTIKVVGSFTNPELALHFAQENPVDIVMTEVDFEAGDGLEMVRLLQMSNAFLIPVFVTSNKTKALQAFALNAADYLVKPFDEQKLHHAVQRATCLCRKNEALPKIVVRTFGHFDVFVDDKPMRFFRQKSKEILAYLVDCNGGFVTVDQIITDIWEDRATDPAARANYQVAFKDLRKDLRNAGIEQILLSSRNQKAVDTTCFQCDYYDLLENDETALRLFADSYLVDYSWAESTNAYCSRLKLASQQNDKNYST